MTREELQAQCERVPFFRFLKFNITHADDETILASMVQTERHIGNPVTGAFHGGITASFMEAIASVSVSRNWDILRPRPINLTIDYLRPALAGTLCTNAKISKTGRRMASIETVAWQADADKPVAKGLFHFLLV